MVPAPKALSGALMRLELWKLVRGLPYPVYRKQEYRNRPSLAGAVREY